MAVAGGAEGSYGYNPLQYPAARSASNSRASFGGVSRSSGGAATLSAAAAGVLGGSSVGPAPPVWQPLWNPVCPWSYDMASSVLLGV